MTLGGHWRSLRCTPPSEWPASWWSEDPKWRVSGYCAKMSRTLLIPVPCAVWLSGEMGSAASLFLSRDTELWTCSIIFRKVWEPCKVSLHPRHSGKGKGCALSFLCKLNLNVCQSGQEDVPQEVGLSRYFWQRVNGHSHALRKFHFAPQYTVHVPHWEHEKKEAERSLERDPTAGLARRWCCLGSLSAEADTRTHSPSPQSHLPLDCQAEKLSSYCELSTNLFQCPPAAKGPHPASTAASGLKTRGHSELSRRGDPQLPYLDFSTSLGTDFPTGCPGCQLGGELISKVSADKALGICILMGELLQEFRPYGMKLWQ